MNKKTWIVAGVMPLFVLLGQTASAAVATAPTQSPDVISAIDPDPQELPMDPVSIETAQKIVPPARTEFSRFGFSLGMGGLSATGNRGALWESANPMYNLALYYWITEQLALDLEGFTVDNAYNTSRANGGHVNVNVQHLEFGVRYYGDLHSLLPRVIPGFISPFGTVGAGVYSMTRSSTSQGVSEPADIQPGMTVGAGLRFQLVPRTLALELLGRWNSVSFKDTDTVSFTSSNALPDLSGQVLSWNANVLITL